MNYSISFVFLLFFVIPLFGNHYRGSMISWRIINSTSKSATVELFQRHTWHYYVAICNDTDIALGTRKMGSGNLNCILSCPPNTTYLTSVGMPCSAYNIPENYTSSEGRVRITLPLNWTLTAAFQGSAWFVLAQGGGNWSVAVQINTFRRTDGRFNQAPIITMLPVIRLRKNQTYNIRINVADNDFDPYQCFWSQFLYECSGICNAVPATTLLNSTTCMLRFTPPKLGYYAIALTVVDYETTTSTIQLSRVPIQFLFKIWESNDTCKTPPVYLGDVKPDECIYVEPGHVLTIRILIRIQCPNATLDNIIGVYPIGFTKSPIILDPYDPNVNVFMVNYTAQIEQIGQNLFCFAGVDSIGNQADTTCLRFTVQQGIASMNSLYLSNTTRYPMGSVSKSQSTWTLIYPIGTTFSRPSTSASIRFKYLSTQQDFLIIDVVTSTINVAYQFDRLVITTNILFIPGQSFYISFDPGVFLPISTCLRDSMGITDPNFWTFSIPSEITTTQLTTTSTALIIPSTTFHSRTSPPIRTINFTSKSSIYPMNTSTIPDSWLWMTLSATTQHVPTIKKKFPISGIVGILLGLLFCLACIIKNRHLILKLRELCKTRPRRIRHFSLRQSIGHYYHVATRMNKRKSGAYTLTTINEQDTSSEEINTNIDGSQGSSIIKNQLVEIEC